MQTDFSQFCRRGAALVLGVALALGAAAWTAAQDASPDVSVSPSSDAVTSTPTPTPVPRQTIYIDDADDLLTLAHNCTLDTWSSDKTVIFRADVSLANTAFRSIPIFSGELDGGGHTVSGLTLSDSDYPCAFIGIVQAGAVVKNLTVSGTVSPSGDAEAVGGIVGINYGTVSFCTFSGTVNGKSSTGGIAGINGMTGTLVCCKSSGGVFGQHATGGVVGVNLGMVNSCQSACYVNIDSVDPTLSQTELQVDLTQSIARFASTDSLNPATDTGGIAGANNGTLRDCTNSGTIGYAHIGYNVGGVAGRSSGYVIACRNTGAVYGRKDVGGVVGQMEPYLDASLSVDLLAQLDAELSELSDLIDKTIDDADGSVQTVTSRMNHMADYMAAAADAVGNMRAYANILSSVLGAGSVSGSVSGEVTVPSVSADGAGETAGDAHVSVDVPSSGEVGGSTSASGEVDVGGTSGSAQGEGSSSAQGSLTASSQISINASQHKLSAALSGMTSQLRLLNGEMSGASTTLSDDVRAVNDQADKVADTAMALFSASNDGTGALLTDTSDENVAAVTFGKVTACFNSGGVYGDIDVGGVAGAMAIEYELDPEDDVSSTLSAGVQGSYALKAILQNCANSGDCTAKRDCVGSVCGRMDLGLILFSNGFGTIASENGDYVGGIVGYSASTVRSCLSKRSLSGRKHVGGVIGSGVAADETRAGSVTQSCYALVQISDSSQYVGAISGSDQGTFTENYFVSDRLAGLGMVSYTGRAAPISYEALGDAVTLPLELRSFTLRFIADDAVVSAVAFRYGDSFDETVFPAIPEKDGYYAVWDATSLQDLRFDTTVTAVYAPYLSALAADDTRASGRPILLAEGAFYEDDRVTLSAEAKTPQSFCMLSASVRDTAEQYFSCFARGERPAASICREIVEQWQIELPDDGQTTHVLRYLSPNESAENLTVFCRQDGTWNEIESKAVGSYLTFSVDGSHAEIAVLSTMQVWWMWLAAAAIVLLPLLLLVQGIKKAKRRKQKQHAAAPAAPDKAPVLQKKKKRVAPLLWTLVCLLVALCAAAFLVYRYTDLGTGLDAMRLLRKFSAEDALSMTLTVHAEADGVPFDTEAQIERVTVDGKQISCITRQGVTLYYDDDAVYLENGRGYRAHGLYPDTSQLIARALDVYNNAEISRTTDGTVTRYTVSAEGDNAKRLLALLLPAYADSLSTVRDMTVELVQRDGVLSALRFAGSITTGDNGTTVSVDATLAIASFSSDAMVPQDVLDAMQAGSADDTELFETVFRLLTAFSELRTRETLCASMRLQADCGPLLLDTTCTYRKTVCDGTTLQSIQAHGITVYFTADAACLADGSVASDAALADTKCAALLELAYQAVLDGDCTFEEANGTVTYTLSQNAEQLRDAATAIAPDTAQDDLRLTDGTVQIVWANGIIESIRFQIDGKMQIVLSETAISLSAALTFPAQTTDEEATVPAAVRAALVQ